MGKPTLVVTPQLRPPDLPKGHAYTLEPGHPTPGLHNLLRPPIASHQGIGILTDFPSATRFRLTLGADSPCADERCAGNLGFSARELFTPFIATHVSIRTSDSSSKGYPSPSQPYGTLSYHRNASVARRAQSAASQVWERSPTAPSRSSKPVASVPSLSPVTLSAPDHLTSELLRTL